MGKKRVVKQKGNKSNKSLKARSLARTKKKKVAEAILHVQATLNNTKVLLSDTDGNTLAFSSSGGLGFRGAKKGTPFAAAEVGALIGEKAAIMGVKEASIIVKGIGSGRESAIRAFTGKGIDLKSIKDRTPVPHGGCRPRKARRV
ncbi:MAG: 30S ribosomal protein S11 [Candidatus Nomurabacteria bacterium]|nr:30S ribosomal protein S11 [Candidatus Nomurabacteria bacterium]